MDSFGVIQACDNSLVWLTGARLPLNELCFTVGTPLLKADSVSYQALLIAQEGEWVGCCEGLGGAASQHLQMCA